MNYFIFSWCFILLSSMTMFFIYGIGLLLSLPSRIIKNINLYIAIAAYTLCFVSSFNYELDEVYWFRNWDKIGISLYFDSNYIVLIRYYSIVFMVYSYLLYRKNDNLGKYLLIYPLLLILQASMMLMTFANDMFNFFVSCELGGIIIYSLSVCKFEKDCKSSNTFKGALEYLIYGSIGSGFLLLGIGIKILESNSFIIQIWQGDFADVILVTGIFIKLSIWPLDFIIKKVYYKLDNFLLIIIGGLYFIPFYIFLFKLQIRINYIIIAFAILLYLAVNCYSKDSRKDLRISILNYMVFSNFIGLAALSLSSHKFTYYLICESLSKMLIFSVLHLRSLKNSDILNNKSINQSNVGKLGLIYYVLYILNNPIVSTFWAKVDILDKLIVDKGYLLLFAVIFGCLVLGYQFWAEVKPLFTFVNKQNNLDHNLGLKPSCMEKSFTIPVIMINKNSNNIYSKQKTTEHRSINEIKLLILTIIIILMTIQATYN